MRRHLQSDTDGDDPAKESAWVLVRMVLTFTSVFVATQTAWAIVAHEPIELVRWLLTGLLASFFTGLALWRAPRRSTRSGPTD